MILTCILGLFFGRESVADSILSQNDACESVKYRASLVLDQKISGPMSAWWCDFVVEKYRPAGFYLVSLHSGSCEGGNICSTLLGWYAVRQADGKVFVWNVARGERGELF